MRCVACSIALLGIFTIEHLPAQTQTDQNQGTIKGQKQKKAPPKTKTDSMTGCVDEQEGHYRLIDEQNREPIADLEAEGFPTEGFAKHVGQKVTVRGTKNPGTERPVFRVRSIETVSEVCAPHALE